MHVMSHWNCFSSSLPGEGFFFHWCLSLFSVIIFCNLKTEGGQLMKMSNCMFSNFMLWLCTCFLLLCCINANTFMCVFPLFEQLINISDIHVVCFHRIKPKYHTVILLKRFFAWTHFNEWIYFTFQYAQRLIPFHDKRFFKSFLNISIGISLFFFDWQNAREKISNSIHACMDWMIFRIEYLIVVRIVSGCVSS